MKTVQSIDVHWWPMYRWWREGGVAWWHGGLLPDVLGMSRGFTLRHVQMIEDFGFDMQFNAETLRPLAQLRYLLTISQSLRVTPFIPRDESPYVKHYCL